MSKSPAAAQKPLKDWEQVDCALACMNAQAQKANGIKMQINELTLELQRELSETLEQLSANEMRIVEFVKGHLSDFGDKKSRKLRSGSVAIREVSSVELDDEAKACEVLRRLGKLDCIKESVKPVKAALKGLDPEVMALIGASVAVDTKVAVKPLVTLADTGK